MMNEPQADAGAVEVAHDFQSTAVPGSVAVIGLGLIGCSIALALRRACATIRIVGYDMSAQSAAQARDTGAVNSLSESPDLAANGAQIVVLAVPPSATIEVGLACRPGVSEGAVVTDVAGAKRRIAAAMQSAYGSSYIGSHPMAGNERSGPQNADASLFRHAPWIVTPTPASSHTAIATVCDLARLVGAVPHAMTPARHDRVVAVLSHLPHALAYSLVATARADLAGSCEALAGGSYRDASRIAASSPTLWRDVLLDNRDEVLRALRAFGAKLGQIERALDAGDGDLLTTLLRNGTTTAGDEP